MDPVKNEACELAIRAAEYVFPEMKIRSNFESFFCKGGASY